MEQWNDTVRAMRNEMREQGGIDISFDDFPLRALTTKCIRHTSTGTKRDIALSREAAG
jgi:hypothetical protein